MWEVLEEEGVEGGGMEGEVGEVSRGRDSKSHLVQCLRAFFPTCHCTCTSVDTFPSLP